MTWFLFTLWFMFTGFNLFSYAPDIQHGTGEIDTWSIEYQMNYQYFQKQVVIEDFFSFADSLGRYNYARWCAGWYGPDRRDQEKQKFVRCSKKSFDCWGVIKAYWFIKWILTRQEVGRNNTKTLYEFWKPIEPMMAERWDFTYWELIQWSWLATTHWAFVWEWLSWNTLKIYDGLGWEFNERELILHCSEKSCIYNTNNWKYKIWFSTNPLWEISQNKGIEIQPFILTGSEAKYIKTWENLFTSWDIKTYWICEINPENPLGFWITIKWYDYDSLANRTANRWYVRNKDKNMIRTYLCENGWFDPDAASQTDDSWLCQLNNHRWNYFWIKDPKRNSKDPIIQFEFQKQACLDKWNLVSEPKKIWTCARNLDKLPDPIIEMTWWFWTVNDK